FGLGMFVRSLLAIRSKGDLVGIAIAIVAGVGFPIYILLENDNPLSLEQNILYSFLFYALVAGGGLYKSILPKISEHTLLLQVLVFEYILLNHIVPISGWWVDLLFYITIIPVFGVLIVSFVNSLIKPAYKALFYLWNVFVSIFFVMFYLFSNEISLLRYENLSFSSP